MKMTMIVLAALVVLSGCVTREKVFANKTTSPRWVNVENPEEFMSEDEMNFLGVKAKKLKQH